MKQSQATAPAPAPAQPPPNPLLVRATRMGFFRGQRVKAGTEFTLDNEKQFSSQWMVRIAETTKPTLEETTHPKAVRRNQLSSAQYLMERGSIPPEDKTRPPDGAAPLANDVRDRNSRPGGVGNKDKDHVL